MHTLGLDRLFSSVSLRSRHPESSRPAPHPAPAAETTQAKAINDAAWMTNCDPSSVVGLAAVAHELRNTLAPLANAVEIMGSGNANPAQLARTLPVARQQIKHMSRLVNDLLESARLVNGRVELVLSTTTVQDLIQEAMRAFADSAARHQHRVTLELPREPLHVQVDIDRIAQVLANLLGNAIKYTPSRGRIAVTVWKDDAWACIRIADNGIGIDPEQLDSIFGMFCQQPRSHDLSEGGMGIGLSLVRSLVELHGGSVSAYSAGKDQGSTFTVRLPLGPDAAAPTPQ